MKIGTRLKSHPASMSRPHLLILQTNMQTFTYATAKVQYLRFPRSGIADQDGYSLDHHTIPTFLKNATAELARYLAAKDRTAEPDTQGFGTVELGSLTVGIDKYDNPPILPRSVRAIIQPYGTVRGGNVAVVRRT